MQDVRMQDINIVCSQKRSGLWPCISVTVVMEDFSWSLLISAAADSAAAEAMHSAMHTATPAEMTRFFMVVVLLAAAQMWQGEGEEDLN